jgi:hypothetical protein
MVEDVSARVSGFNVHSGIATIHPTFVYDYDVVSRTM